MLLLWRAGTENRDPASFPVQHAAGRNHAGPGGPAGSRRSGRAKIESSAPVTQNRPTQDPRIFGFLAAVKTDAGVAAAAHADGSKVRIARHPSHNRPSSPGSPSRPVIRLDGRSFVDSLRHRPHASRAAMRTCSHSIVRFGKVLVSAYSTLLLSGRQLFSCRRDRMGCRLVALRSHGGKQFRANSLATDEFGLQR
jgi:hypothetical protein